jgi:hypothetical protein
VRRFIVLGLLAVAALASVVLLGVVPKLSTAKSAGCSVSTLHGAYGWVGGGTSIGAGPWSALGIRSFDGAGHTSLDGTFSLNGRVFTSSYPGTYTVNANCTGAVEAPLPNGIGALHLALVVVDGGREFYWMITDDPRSTSGATINGVGKRM